MDDLPSHFTGLPIRPPTPPKEFGSDDVVPIIEKSFESIRLQSEVLYTPNESPVSVATYPLIKTSVKSTKHVGFSPLSPAYGSSGSLSFAGPLRNIPPSRECASRKSILKSYDTRLVDLSRVELKGADEMLESLCRGLASPTKSARLDAYMTLIGCLKTYKDVPERDLLESKVSLLSDFIKRDISTDAEDVVASQIRVQSLKLLIVFLAEPIFSNLLPHDFQCHIVDRAVKVLEEHDASKAIINLYMMILATQDFKPSIITEARALDILAALEDLTDHVKGNGTVGLRQRIYNRLVRQSKPAMVKCVNVWASHLFSAMLSASKETRLQAFNFGREASMALGTQSRVSSSVQDIFNRTSPAGKKFLSTVTKRLTEMIGNDEEKTDVPLVWAIVVMFLHSRPRQLEHWEYMREWMVIIQKCFNSSSSMVKHNAALAWNRLVCAVDLNTSTSPGMIRTLKQPIKAQLDRSTLEKTSHRTKQMAYSSYCTLLYYAFRPQRPASQISLFWKEYVEGILLDCDCLVARIDADYIFQIFTYLFDHGQPWTEKRAAEDPPIRPKDLPCLLPSWVHENAPRILRFFEISLPEAKWEVGNDEDPWIVKAWNSFTTAIGRASGKEIKTSMETMSAVAGIMNCLQRYWLLFHNIPQVIRLQRTSLLWKLATLDKIHPLAFTECRLTGTCRDRVTPVATPSTHSDLDPTSAARDSAMACFAKSLCSPQIHETSIESLAAALKDVLEIAISTSPSRQNTLKIMRDVTSDLNSSTNLRKSDRMRWQAVVNSLEKVVDGTKKYGANGNSSRLPASDLSEIIDILELGLRLDCEPEHSWQHTISTLAKAITQELGRAGLAAGFIEPLALRIEQLWHAEEANGAKRDENLLGCTIALMRNVVWPDSQKDLRDASLLIWGMECKRPVPVPSDPYVTLYELVTIGLAKGFQCSQPLVDDNHNELLEVTVSFLRSIPAPLSAKALTVIQPGIALWISGEDHAENAQPEVILALWELCAETVKHLPSFDTVTATSIETLLASALSTKHAAIADDALKLWKKTFGLDQDLIVPDSVSEALACVKERRKRHATKSATSRLNDKMDVERGVSRVRSDREDDDNAVKRNVSIARDSRKSSPSEQTPREQAQRTKRPTASIRHTTPRTSPKSRRSRHTPPKRLRHEDSQIVFTAIHSSPYDTESLVSQFLTSHQRELRDRQQSEANAMFPDIRSDPLVRSARKERKAPRLSMEDMESSQKEPEEWSSPVLSTKEPVMDDFVQSSPTPGPSRHASSSCLPEDGPPSSPPAKATDRPKKVGTNQHDARADYDDLEGVMDQRAQGINAIEHPAGEDSGFEPSFLVSATRDLDDGEAMDLDNGAEPSLPELVDQRSHVTGGKVQKEIVAKTLTRAVMTAENQVKNDHRDHRDHLGSKNSVITSTETSAISSSLPESSNLRSQHATHASLVDDPASEADVYVDAPSSLLNTQAKASKGGVFEQLRRNEEGHWVMVSSPILHGGDAAPDKGDAVDNDKVEDQFVSRNDGDQPTSSDVDEQVSQQIAADMERALTQVEQARRADSSSDVPNRPSHRKRKTSASSSPEKQTRKSPRTNIKVVIKRSFETSQDEVAQAGATVGDDGLLDCIVVATPPIRVPMRKPTSKKAKREPAHSTSKPRKQSSATSAAAKRRCSSRLSQGSSRAGSFYSDEPEESQSHGKTPLHPAIAPVEEDRGEPKTNAESSGIQREEQVDSADHGPSTGIQESGESTGTTTTHPPTSPASPPRDDTSTAENPSDSRIQTTGDTLLLRLRALVEEAKHVVLERGQQRRLLSTWMDLGQELHHADADSRAA